MPQVTGQGTEVTLENTIEAPFTKFDVEGNSEQETNLFDGKLSQGTLDSTGVEVDSVYRIRTTNYIEVVGGTTIPIKAQSNKEIQYLVYVFNNSKEIIETMGWNDINTSKTLRLNAKYIKLLFSYKDGSAISTSNVTNVVVGDVPNPNYEQPVKSAGENVNEVDDALRASTINNVYIGASNAITTFNIPAGTHTISTNVSCTIQVLSSSSVIFSSSANVSKFTFTLEQNTGIRIRLQKYGITSDDVEWVKLEKGTVATPWSPYGMGCMNEKIESRNLFKPKEVLVKIMSNFSSNNILTKNTSTDISISDDNYMHGKSSNYIGIVNKFNFIKGKTIYNKGYRGVRSVMVYNSNGTPVAILQPPTIQYTPSETFEGYIGIGIDANDTNADDKYIMFSYDENATYSQYQGEQNISIPTQQPMMDDDYFDRENNEEVHTWQKIVLDGSSDEDWGIQNNRYFICTTSKEISGNFHNKWFAQVIGTNSLQYTKSNIGVLDYGVLDHQTGFGLALAYGVRINLENIDVSKGGTVEQLRAYLAENPITVYVKLKESAYEKLPFTQLQIDAFNEVDEAYSYKGGTYITSPDEVKARIKVSGLRDLNVLFNN